MIMLRRESNILSFSFTLLFSKSTHRFSAKEGATRTDQARPRTNIQVLIKETKKRNIRIKLTTPRTSIQVSVKKTSWLLSLISSFILCQTLDGKFGDGESEAHGKYSAKEGLRPSQARPQTHMQVLQVCKYAIMQVLHVVFLCNATAIFHIEP